MERILERLMSGGTVSGQAVSAELGVTRAAVWKQIEQLRALGFEVTDSLGNFVFARSGRMPGAALAAALRERGILVRRWDAPRIADWLRITVGAQAEMEALVRAVTEILKEG